ncbi:unnamed protein product [Oppiella nova]|uniref:RRM domain-containing protein n=1 Tax=Oppiella nova TaxID=334625 RepID=A0A7R9MN30_9ACAR|nr:unnamed protein product [Oppiella nova]CAG2180425.1 unnamed protein product [Oppiella nova]
MKVSDQSSDPLKKRKNLFDDMISKKCHSSDSSGASNRGFHFGTNCGQIFVENLKYEVTEEDIRQLFEAFGSLKRAAINYEKSGRSSGTALVVFENKSDAINALNTLQNITLDDRMLVLTLIDGNTNSQELGLREANLNARLKQSKQGSSCSGRDLWSDLAMNYDKNEEQSFGRNKRFPYSSDKKEKEVFSAQDLDEDLDSYLAQRSKE